MTDQYITMQLIHTTDGVVVERTRSSDGMVQDRRARFRTATRRAAAIVATWPVWRRNVLLGSMRATNPKPREEVKPKSILKR